MGRIKLGKDVINVRVLPETRTWWNLEAVAQGYVFGDSGQVGAFLDAIAEGKFEIKKVENK